MRRLLLDGGKPSRGQMMMNFRARAQFNVEYDAFVCELGKGSVFTVRLPGGTPSRS
jgi:hypothetical protein